MCSVEHVAATLLTPAVIEFCGGVSNTSHCLNHFSRTDLWPLSHLYLDPRLVVSLRFLSRTDIMFLWRLFDQSTTS